MSQYYNSQQAAFRLSQANSAFINQLLVSGRGKELPTTIALAMFAAAKADLPGGTVESPEAYFMENVGANSAEAINTLNEIVPVDYRRAIDLARKIYLLRYELAVKPFHAFGYNLTEGINSIFGLCAHLPEDVLKCMQCNAADITCKYMRFNEIFNEIEKKD